MKLNKCIVAFYDNIRQSKYHNVVIFMSGKYSDEKAKVCLSEKGHKDVNIFLGYKL